MVWSTSLILYILWVKHKPYYDKGPLHIIFQIVIVSGEELCNYRINLFLTNSWVGEGRKKKSVCECEWVSHSLNMIRRVQRRKTYQAWPWEDPQGPQPQSSLNSGPGWTQSLEGQLFIGNSSTWSWGTGACIKIKASEQGSEAAGMGSLAMGYLWLKLVWSSALKDFATMLLWTSFFWNCWYSVLLTAGKAFRALFLCTHTNLASSHLNLFCQSHEKIHHYYQKRQELQSSLWEQLTILYNLHWRVTLWLPRKWAQGTVPGLGNGSPRSKLSNSWSVS